MMELVAAFMFAGLVFVALSVSRAHWYRLADIMHRIGPAGLRRLGWPVAHPFSQLDPKAGGQDGALGVFPQRTTRLRVLARGLPPGDLPNEARHHAARFRLWALLLAIGVTVATAALHPAAPVAVAALAALGRAFAPRWPDPGAAAIGTNP